MTHIYHVCQMEEVPLPRAFVKTLVKGLKWFKSIKACVFITIRGAPPHNKLWDKFKGGFVNGCNHIKNQPKWNAFLKGYFKYVCFYLLKKTNQLHKNQFGEL